MPKTRAFPANELSSIGSLVCETCMDGTQHTRIHRASHELLDILQDIVHQYEISTVSFLGPDLSDSIRILAPQAIAKAISG